VAGSCEYGDEPLGSSVTVSYLSNFVVLSTKVTEKLPLHSGLSSGSVHNAVHFKHHC
jgi:hypothetical protein